MRIGSSPLARGLPWAHESDFDTAGIIPARAGFTPFSSMMIMTPPDHPRSRGVYSAGRMVRGRSFGSSPLARGLLPGGAERVQGRGIIPARAGFTAGDFHRVGRGQDHPRSRGVYCGAISVTMDTGGSSPLARGLPASTGEDESHNRIIPARAGFTGRRRYRRRGRGDHPRSRGVYIDDMGMFYAIRGSSPLARGLPTAISGACAQPRIIPARAGFT